MNGRVAGHQHSGAQDPLDNDVSRSAPKHRSRRGQLRVFFVGSLYSNSSSFTLDPSSKPFSDRHLHVLQRWKCDLAVNFCDWQAHASRIGQCLFKEALLIIHKVARLSKRSPAQRFLDLPTAAKRFPHITRDRAAVDIRLPSEEEMAAPSDTLHRHHKMLLFIDAIFSTNCSISSKATLGKYCFFATSSA